MNHRSPDKRPLREVHRKGRVRVAVVVTLAGFGLIIAGFLITNGWLILGGFFMLLFGLLGQR